MVIVLATIGSIANRQLGSGVAGTGLAGLASAVGTAGALQQGADRNQRADP